MDAVPSGAESSDAKKRKTTNDYLRSLDLSESEFSFLPYSKRLQWLERLNLEWAKEFKALPEEVGNLRSLEVLNLRGSGIQRIPSSIGKLQCLKDLSLKDTIVSDLPEEIGNLGSLEILQLSGCTKLSPIPPVIFKLQNLKHLHLTRMYGSLVTLPEEIGNLISLEYLSLSASRIKTLPSTICRLHNLKLLGLQRMNQLSELPKEIGNLTNLICLDLNESDKVGKLPTSFGKLKKLQYFEFDFSENNKDQKLKLAKDHPSLLYFDQYFRDSLNEIDNQLVRNRVRFNTSKMETSSGLLPFMLEGATRAYSDKSIEVPSYVKSYYNRTYMGFPPAPKTSSADALYQLLTIRRDAFIGALVERGKNRE